MGEAIGLVISQTSTMRMGLLLGAGKAWEKRTRRAGRASGSLARDNRLADPKFAAAGSDIVRPGRR